MSPELAEKIINNYGGAVASLPEGDMVMDITKLPNSPGKIRYAFFVYTEALINEDLFTDEIKQNLESSYALLKTRFVEDPDEINAAWRKYKTDPDARKVIEAHGGLTALGIPSIDMMTEYHNFVVDCYGNWGK